jgi:hypothetical protein
MRAEIHSSSPPQFAPRPAYDQAVVTAMESALAQEDRPLHERIADIARDASRLSRGKRGRPVSEREVDELWGNSQSCPPLIHNPKNT